MKKIYFLFIIIFLSLLIIFLKDFVILNNDYNLAKKYLDKKSTDLSLGCGPPDDWDCGWSRYQGWAILTNAEAYEKTKEIKYLDYALKFANTKPSSPPSFCSNCSCGPPDDWDCGNGEDQALMIQAFAYLYKITKNETLLKYAENFIKTKPSSPATWCPDCSCGPPDDWDCGKYPFIQTAYAHAYYLMYQVTNDITYIDYIKNLAKAYENKNESYYKANFYIDIYLMTKDYKYLDYAEKIVKAINSSNYYCGPPDKWQCPAIAYETNIGIAIITSLRLYELTKSEEYLELAKNFGEAGGSNCGPIKTWKCDNMIAQSYYTLAYYGLYKDTNSIKYKQYYDNFRSIISEGKLCPQFDCKDSEYQYLTAHVLLILNEQDPLLKYRLWS